MHNGWGSYSPCSPHMPILPHVPFYQSMPMPSASSAEGLIPPAAPFIKTIPLPPTSFDVVQLNPRLAYAAGPCIEYDVRRHPAYASSPDAAPEWEYEPATNPPTSEIIVVCMILPRPFVVRPSNRDRNFVTIRDILVATHNAFREAAKGDIAADDWVPGVSRQVPCPLPVMASRSWTGTSTGRYKWAGLSEQYKAGSWLLHVE